MSRPDDSDLCFTLSVTDEHELAAASLRQLRRVYPASDVAMLVDGPSSTSVYDWQRLADEVRARVVATEGDLYAVAMGGCVVEAHLDAFLSTRARWWLKIDPDTWVRRAFDDLPDECCFFGTLQGGNPLPSLQGGCIGGPRVAAERLRRSGALSSPELIDYERSWARDNPILVRRAREKGLVSFDFVHAWACARAGIPIVDHSEIRSHWLGPPGNGARYAVTHPHKSLDIGTAADQPSALALGVRALVRSCTPDGAVVAVVSHGDDELVDIPGREGWHFPRHALGYYTAEHPADSGHAIAHLEGLRARGVGYLVVPEPSSWWLEHYLGFRHHLERRYELVSSQPGIGVLYDVRSPQPAAPANINTPEYWDSIYREELELGEAASADYKRDYGPIHDAIVELVPDAARVLDVGCGPGFLCRKIKERRPAAQVVGVDFSSYVVERNRARDADLGIRYERLDIRYELSALGGGFDVVTLCEVIEHLDDPELVVADAVSLLRVGGRLIVTCPHDDSIRHPEHVRQWGHDEVFHLLHRFSDEVVFRGFRAPWDRWLLAHARWQE